MTDYRIQVRIRNARILNRIDDAGYNSLAHLCSENNLPYTRICQIVGLKISAFAKDGEWRECVRDLAGALQCDPSDLFTDRQARADFKTTQTAHDIAEAVAIPFINSAPQIEAKCDLQNVMKELTPRLQKLLTMKYGLSGDAPMTFREIGDSMNVTGARARHLVGIAKHRIKKILAKRGYGQHEGSIFNDL